VTATEQVYRNRILPAVLWNIFLLPSKPAFYVLSFVTMLTN
jgi:hypothetical protein